VGEATWLPIMPDAIIVPLALARPDAWRRLALTAMLGSSVCGAVSYWLGRRTPEVTSVERLPLVRPAMVAATEQWLASEGPRGAVRQPLTGVPFKVFGRLAGLRGLPIAAFLAWALAARGPRFLIAAYGAALVARRLGPFAPRRLATLSGFWWLTFAVGLRRTVVHWERRTQFEVGGSR
jgi:membrane protein YqaA with SNARE-associated domain